MDHASLKLLSFRNPGGQLASWLVSELAEFAERRWGSCGSTFTGLAAGRTPSSSCIVVTHVRPGSFPAAVASGHPHGACGGGHPGPLSLHRGQEPLVTHGHGLLHHAAQGPDHCSTTTTVKLLQQIFHHFRNPEKLPINQSRNFKQQVLGAVLAGDH